MRAAAALLAAALPLTLAGCTGGGELAAPVANLAPPRPPPAAAAATGPVLAADGTCQGTPAGAPAAIAPGIGECDLVQLKGKPPTDVLVGESGKGQREVQVLYAEPTGKELYFFVNNRLDRIVK